MGRAILVPEASYVLEFTPFDVNLFYKNESFCIKIFSNVFECKPNGYRLLELGKLIYRPFPGVANETIMNLHINIINIQFVISIGIIDRRVVVDSRLPQFTIVEF